LQELGELVGVKRGIEGNDCASCRDDAEINGDPAGMVICEDGQRGSMCELFIDNPTAYRFGHAAQFGISTTFQVIRALKLKRNVIGPAVGAFAKTVVESGHRSWGIYTKNLLTAENTEIAKKVRT